jgi:hypothetical protein
MERESATQKGLLLIESILSTDKQLQHARLSWRVRCPSFMDSINSINPAIVQSSRSFSVQNTTILLKLL